MTYRNDSIEDTSTPTIDQASANHPLLVLGRSLQASTNDSNAGAHTNSLDTSEAITNGATNQTADESTKVVDRDDPALKDGVRDNHAPVWSSMAESHERVVVVCGVNTAHHTLIITEEQDTETCDAVDSLMLLVELRYSGVWSLLTRSTETASPDDERH